MDQQSISTPTFRLASIDILRALTMVLMIFVNDLWSLKEIPEWLEHVPFGADGIGLADVVFPAFLFIVGLSIPYAIDNRRKKGDTDWQLVQHVVIRAIALLIMGVFLVNGETINETATGWVGQYWGPVCCTCFILIWNSYSPTANKSLVTGAKAVGLIVLVVVAILYRGGKDDHLQTFAPQWWGILGLIGWAYLVGGLVTVFARNKFSIILSAWIFFAMLSMLSKAGYIPHIFSFIPEAILGGTLTGLTIGGVLTTLIFRHYSGKQDHKGLTIVFLAMAALWIILSVITRPYWGLAKLGATPAWLFLCSAFTILAFLVIYWVADVKKKEKWFQVIKPAGTGTLLCYLIPYYAYATTRALGIHWPDWMLTGGVGLVKSALFAVLCAVITGLLIRLGVRLKL